MSYQGIRQLPLMLMTVASAILERYRFVTINKITGLVSYAFGSPNGVTLARSDTDGATSVQPLTDLISTFFIDLYSSVTKGDYLFATTDGKAVSATHSDVINRGKQSSAPSSPSNGDKYIVPSTGWSGSHGNAIAIYTTSWSYTEVDSSTNVGMVVFVEDEGSFVQWTGSAWIKVTSNVIAQESGAAGSTIVAYKDTGVDSLGYSIKSAGTYSMSSGATTAEIVDQNISDSDVISVTITANSGTAYVVKAVPSTGKITVTLSESATASFSYVVLNPKTI